MCVLEHVARDRRSGFDRGDDLLADVRVGEDGAGRDGKSAPLWGGRGSISPDGDGHRSRVSVLGSASKPQAGTLVALIDGLGMQRVARDGRGGMGRLERGWQPSGNSEVEYDRYFVLWRRRDGYRLVADDEGLGDRAEAFGGVALTLCKVFT